MEQLQTIEGLEAMAERLALMEESLAGIERRLAPGSGEVERMLATVSTVEQVSAAQIESLESRLAETERQLAALQASAAQTAPQGRRTLTASASSLLAKHGIGEAGPVEASALDAALVSLPVEQRIAVKSQLLRAGLLS
jgi:ferritin-like metal-binding protein YciE